MHLDYNRVSKKLKDVLQDGIALRVLPWRLRCVAVL